MGANTVKFLNRLAHREFLTLVAVAASALTLHIRERVIDMHAQPAQASHLEYGPLCEAPAARTGKARVLPAACGVRANRRPDRTHASWV
jgi:hypothetical protein